MNELQKVFNYQDQQVRTVVKDGQPWFVAKDVCNVLNHSNHKVAASRLDEDEVSKVYLTDSLVLVIKKQPLSMKLVCIHLF
nr:BRO family protein [Bacillus subtilis]